MLTNIMRWRLFRIKGCNGVIMNKKDRDNNNTELKTAAVKTLLILTAALLIDCIISIIMVHFDSDGEVIGVASNMLEGVIAAAAAGLVIHELRQNERQDKRENDIKEATFLLQYNQAFIQDPNMNLVESLLEKQSVYGHTEPIIDDDNRQKFINYLVYLEGLAPLILNDIMRLEHIDDLMSYRFFLAVNNQELQQDQLNSFPQFYRGCFKLYRKWTSYYAMNGMEIPFSDHSLDKLPIFDEYSKGEKKSS